MTPLFDGTGDELRKFVPGLIKNFTVPESLKTTLQETQESLLTRFLGATLAEQVAASSASNDAVIKSSFTLAQTVIARLGFAEYLPAAEIQIGNDGITITAVENRRAAFDYQTQKLDKSLREGGWTKLDELILLIAANAEKFPGWAEAPYNQELTEAIFKSAAEFSKYYQIQNRWLTFWALRPYISAVEDNFGQTYLQKINTLPSSVTADQKKPLLRNLMRCLAYEAVITALPNLSVELAGVNVQINYGSQYGGNSSYYTPPGREMLDWVKQNLLNQVTAFWSTVDQQLEALNPTPTTTNDEWTGLSDDCGPIVMI
ncbi:hypothetical protein GCM10028805_47490 [Spirosoma harenae]